jgi:WD40 repeat protein
MLKAVEIMGNGNDYEKVREEQVRKNRERMLELNLPQASAQVAEKKKVPARKASQRGVKRVKKEQPTVARRSLRVRGFKPNGELSQGVASETAGGVSFESSKLGSASFFTEPSKPARKTGPIKLESVFADEEENETKMLANLRNSSSSSASASGSTGVGDLSKVSLDDEDHVMKLTKNGSVHLDIMPREDMALIAAGDKSGNIGFWSLSSSSSSPSSLSEQCSLQVAPHAQYISGMKWCPRGTGRDLYSCSYDGVARRFDLEKASFLEIFSTEDHEFSAFDVGPTGNTVYLADNTGDCLIYDLRSSKVAHGPTELHTRKVNTVHVEPTAGNLVVTSSSGAEVSVWDMRKLGKGSGKSKSGMRLLTFNHPKSCQAAYFAPDGSQRILTTCYDCHLRVFDCKSESKKKAGMLLPQVTISHNTQTGRWVLPLRAIWTPSADGIICGSMKRAVHIYNGHTGKKEVHCESEFLTAIPSRVFVHPTLALLGCATNSGRTYLFS